MPKASKMTNDKKKVMMTMRKSSGKSMKEFLAEQQPSEMSIQEKDILCMLLPEAPELPYPLQELKMAYGPSAREYLIPEEKRDEVLKALYPFAECPSLEAKIYDLHERKYFLAKEYRVIRERDRNLLTSPYYPSSGGMVVDWLPDEETDTYIQRVEA